MKTNIKYILIVPFGIIIIVLFIFIQYINHNNDKNDALDNTNPVASQPFSTEAPAVETTSPSTEPYIKPLDKPTIPPSVHEDLYFQWDFSFSERYDARITDDFSLIFPKASAPSQASYALFDHFNDENLTAEMLLHESDDLVPPSQHNLYWYTNSIGGLFIDTDYFELDEQQFIAYLWSNMDGVSTNKGVAVGSSESELLIAYEEALYFLEKEEALSEKRSNLVSYNTFFGEKLATLEEPFDFEYAFVWQPFTPETNDIRDIMFYMKENKVVAIEMNKPSELRFVYGFDRELVLQKTDLMRQKAIENLSPEEKLIYEYVNAIENHQWEAYVSLFEYSDDASTDLLKFLTNEVNKEKKEGIHGITNIDVLKIEPTTDLAMQSKGEKVYDVYFEMSVENPSEFYGNGISLHTFVFKFVDDALKIDTVYYRGLTERP